MHFDASFCWSRIETRLGGLKRILWRKKSKGGTGTPQFLLKWAVCKNLRIWIFYRKKKRKKNLFAFFPPPICRWKRIDLQFVPETLSLHNKSHGKHLTFLIRHLNRTRGWSGVGEWKGKTSVQLPLSFPLTKPSHSRNHCMLMQYMTTGDSSSWNALFSYRGSRRSQREGERKWGWSER